MWRKSIPLSAVSWWTITSGSASATACATGVGVERVGHDGPGAEHAQQVLLGRGLGHADDLVAAGHELGDEPLAEGARGAGDEDLHGGLLSRHCTQQTRWPTGL
jgi:hypothetical protein